MTYIVAEPCIGTKDHACVDVCPVECFYEGEDILLIHPEECIDCGACEPECPVTAIFEATQVPEQWKDYIAKNADPFKDGAHNLPVAVQKSVWEAQREEEGSVANLYYKKYPKKE
jgi:NAD-dependent dihydropyrimidine dehydrogenase PreA subunit